MHTLHLIMPMGGAGTRFFHNGFIMPKPLIEIHGKPFFYWATRSVEKYVEPLDITFVVLKQHVADFGIDKAILKYFPAAKLEIVAWEEVKAGPVMTCLAGLRHIDDDRPVLFNDCDHMFGCDAFARAMNSGAWEHDGALLTFPSDQPQFSYLRYDGERIVGTVEKKVVSSHAICGAYMFRDAGLFRELTETYIRDCGYSELFVSGLYNVLCEKGLTVQNYSVDFHVPFGTPAEYEKAKSSDYFEMLA